MNTSTWAEHWTEPDYFLIHTKLIPPPRLGRCVYQTYHVLSKPETVSVVAGGATLPDNMALDEEGAACVESNLVVPSDRCPDLNKSRVRAGECPVIEGSGSCWNKLDVVSERYVPSVVTYCYL